MELPIFPLNTVLFPGAHLPLHIFEERYKEMVRRCLEEKAPFGVCLIREGEEAGAPAEPFKVGTTAHIVRVQRLEEGRLNIVCLGGQRFAIREIIRSQPYLVAEVEALAAEQVREDAEEVRAASAELFREYVRLTLAMNNQWARSIEMPAGAAPLSDYVASRIEIDLRTRQRLLEELSPKLRLEVEAEVLRGLIEQLGQRVNVARAQRWFGFAVMN